MAITSESDVILSNGSRKEQGRVDIIDIRRAAVEINLKDEILSMFQAKNGPRQLPTLLLYNARGLQLFEQLTYLDEYYLTNGEIAILESFAAEMVAEIPAGAMFIELGSGNLRKVNLLLQALENAEKAVDYYALDLSREELERTLAQLPAHRYVRCHGLLGTYDDGREWLKQPSNLERRKCILSLGSSIGNFHRHEAVSFLKHFSDLLNPGDTMLIGLDACHDPAKVYHAYNDNEGLTHKFLLNGLRNANDILGETIFREEDWRAFGEYVYDDEGGRHQAFYSPRRDLFVMGEAIRAHERIQVEQSLKYSREQANQLWKQSGMAGKSGWGHGHEYRVHMLVKPKMSFSLIPSVYARCAVPSLGDWEALWATWDAVTCQMLPEDQLLSKPIKLRNACIFYLGHIPTFLDVQLTKRTKTALTEPASYANIFERGIDPDVDNPERCHQHSEVPDEWPQVHDILTYQDRVRARLQGLYGAAMTRPVAEAIWTSFEHEAMHLETLLYMMLQSDKTLAPKHAPRPDFEKLAALARAARVPNQWFDVPAQTVTIGMDEPAHDADTQAPFVWDNEKPSRRVKVDAFQAKGRPITNEEFAQYVFDTHATTMPASWALMPGSEACEETNGRANGHANGLSGHANGALPLPESFLDGKAVRTVYGLVPLKHALDWPVFASYDELVGCAAYMGGRIPTFEEAKSIYAYVYGLKKEQAEKHLVKTVPAVNGHLSNNGVHQTPPPGPDELGGEDPQLDLFADLDGANVGFHHWHPVAVTGRGDRLAGQSEMGGVWEWTSTTLARHEGFQPTALYPGFTADFFDGKHNIVLGGSWATHPRIAGRKTFVNWYQRNYPYPWVGARLVRDQK